MNPSYSPASSTAWRWVGASLLMALWLTGCSPEPDKNATQAATAAAAAQGSANLAWDGQRVTLSGEVGSDGDKQKLLAAAATTYGAGNVVDQVKVTKGLGRLGGITLSGTVANDADKAQRSTAMADALPMVPVENRLTVAAPAGSAVAAAQAAATAVAASAQAAATQVAAPAPTVAQTPAQTPAPTPAPTAVASAPASPASAPTPVAAAAPANCAQLMGLQVTFASGSARVTSQNAAQLRQAAKCISSPTLVSGYADDQGSAASNARLSQARAQAALNLLVQNGAKRPLLTANGFGSEKPVADNTTEEGRAKNRRIELTVQ